MPRTSLAIPFALLTACSGGDEPPQIAGGDLAPPAREGVRRECSPAAIRVTGLPGGAVAEGLTIEALKAARVEVAKVDAAGDALPCTIDLSKAELSEGVAVDYMGLSADGWVLAIMDGTSDVRSLRMVNAIDGDVTYSVQSQGSIERNGDAFRFDRFADPPEGKKSSDDPKCKEAEAQGLSCRWLMKAKFEKGTATAEENVGWVVTQ